MTNPDDEKQPVPGTGGVQGAPTAPAEEDDAEQHVYSQSDRPTYGGDDARRR